MSFKIRNTIVLGVMFFLITAAGFIYWNFIQPKQLVASQDEIRRIERELQQLPQTIEAVQRLMDQYFDVKRKYDSRSKEIPASDMSSQTYAYMSRGIDEAGFLRFNMTYNGSRELTSWGFNAYTLTEGEAEFWNLYRFVYFLENGRRLYKINSLNIDQREEVNQDTKETRKWLVWTMELHA
ncbi:MAG: hypothetical protein WD295_04970, partial [Bacteroidota bacterium]